MRHVALFDTNVLLSGVGWKGKPFQCLELARVGIVESLTCQEILDELAEKLLAKLNLPSDKVAETLADLLLFHRIARITNKLRVITADPDDDKILECAVVGGATHIVSGDRRHLLPLGNYQGIDVISPAQFLQLVSGSSAPPAP